MPKHRNNFENRKGLVDLVSRGVSVRQAAFELGVPLVSARHVIEKEGGAKYLRFVRKSG